MDEEVLKELREIRYIVDHHLKLVREGVYILGAILILGLAALYWK